MKLHTVFFWLYDNFLEGNTDEIKRDFFLRVFFICKTISFYFFYR
jgi:hypothetical protein